MEWEHGTFQVIFVLRAPVGPARSLPHRAISLAAHIARGDNPGMPRTARASVGGLCYHALNRGNGRAQVFHDADDYHGFVRLLRHACARVPMRLLGFCLMPNHFHLVLWPHGDGDLSVWMQWLLTAHVHGYRRRYRGGGHVWQGRFKAFPIAQDEHLLTVLRDSERNPLRANLVSWAEDWAWSSLPLWLRPPLLPWHDPGPVLRHGGWLEYAQTPHSVAELAALRRCVERGTPYGSATWVERTAAQRGLDSSLRPPGRPRRRVALDGETEGLFSRKEP
jgi:putative transposase